jgi:hypothetical protein
VVPGEGVKPIIDEAKILFVAITPRFWAGDDKSIAVIVEAVRVIKENNIPRRHLSVVFLLFAK